MAVSVFLCEDSYDAFYWYLVRCTLKASQVVPTSEPMNILISEISIARRRASSLAVAAFVAGEVISPALAVSVALAKMVAMPAIGLSWLHSESFPGCA